MRTVRGRQPHRPSAMSASRWWLEGEQRADDAVGAALVIDEAARAELGERQEARTLQVGLASPSIVRRRHVRHQRQAREVVARQEALGGEVAVGVEVAREAAVPVCSRLSWSMRLRVAGLRRRSSRGRRAVVVHRCGGRVALLLGGESKRSRQRSKALSKRSSALARPRAFGELVAPGVPGPALGREVIGQQIEHAAMRRSASPLTARAASAFHELGRSGRLGSSSTSSSAIEGSSGCFGAGQPDGLQVALDEVAVGQVEQRRADLAVHHRPWGRGRSTGRAGPGTSSRSGPAPPDRCDRRDRCAARSWPASAARSAYRRR